MSVLEVHDVHRSFPGTPPLHALRGVSFEAHRGEVLGLLGVNGAGKTTLLRIISTLLLPTSGTARVCGHDVVHRGRDARANLGVVFGGDRGLYTRLTAMDNLVFFGGLAGIRRGLRRRAAEALEQVGLADRANSRVETFSRGMRQRVHLAAGLLHRPPLVLLDEPTVGLDAAEAHRVRDTVAALATSGVTILLTSHYPVDIEVLAHRVVVLAGGVISHDLPIAAFRQLAGFVAEVHIRGRGDPGPLTGFGTARDTSVTQATDGTWEVRLRLRSWDPAALARVSSIAAAAQVTDLTVEPVGLDTVLQTLFGQVGVQ
jgi:ABC-2 type transport system ATP-binding protein